GWELIASPEIFIAAAAERTRHIMLGSGVTSLPYHHPFLVAQRFVQLDHMTRGRAMLGCGPGALVSDAYMMGIEPVTQRPRMDEALDAIMALLRCEEPVTLKTDWFEVGQAARHVAEDDEEALRQVKRAERHETITYFEETLGRPPGRSDDPLTEGVKMGTTLVGSVDTVVRGIRKLWELSDGGFGGLLFRAHEWANREQTRKSYELFARYVMPHFQGSGEGPRGSNEWARGNRKTIFSP